MTRRKKKKKRRRKKKRTTNKTITLQRLSTLSKMGVPQLILL